MWKPITILVLIIASAVATAAVIFQSIDRSDVVYTDGATIRQSVDDAPIRSVLWTPPVALPDSINTPQFDEYEPREYGGGLTLLFVRGRAGENADIWRAEWAGDGWAEPAPFDELNSTTDDLGPYPAPDGSAIYFYSDRMGGHGGYDLWVVRRMDGGEWAAPENLGPAVNTSHNEYGPALSPEGDQLYFASNRPKPDEPVVGSREHWPATIRETRDRRDYDLFVAALNDRGVGEPRRLEALNSPHDEGAPAVSTVGDFLYFASDRPGGLGGFDLYRTRRESGGHGSVERLGAPVNTESNELDPALRHLGFELLFSSDRFSAAAGDDDESPRSRYDLFVSESREVYRDTEPARSSFDWSAIIPWLWLLALLALLLLLLLLLRRFATNDVWRDRWRKLSLLAKCLILSLLAHALLMLLLAAWQVSPALLDVFDRDGGGTKVALVAPANMAIVSQLHGALELPAVDAPTPTVEAPPEPLSTNGVAAPAELAVESDAEALTASAESVELEDSSPERAQWSTPDEVDRFSPAPAPTPTLADAPADSAPRDAFAEEQLTLAPDQPAPLAPTPIVNRSATDAPIELPPTNEFARAPLADPAPVTPAPATRAAPRELEAFTPPSDAPVADAPSPEFSIPDAALPRRNESETATNDAARIDIRRTSLANSSPPPGEFAPSDSSTQTVEALLETPEFDIPRLETNSLPPAESTTNRPRTTFSDPVISLDPDSSRDSLASLTIPSTEFDRPHEARVDASSEEISDETRPRLRRDAAMHSEALPAMTEALSASIELDHESNATVAPYSSPVEPSEVTRQVLSPSAIPALGDALAVSKLAIPSTASEERRLTESDEESRTDELQRLQREASSPSRAAPPMVLDAPAEEMLETTPAVSETVSLLSDRSLREASPMQEMIDAAVSRRSSLDFATAETPDFPGVSTTPQLAIPLDRAPAADAYAQRDPEVRERLVAEGGGNAETEEAVAMALDWLRRHQSRDGKWSGRSFDDQCGRCGGQAGFDFDRALTGLSLLCFLGANHTHEFDGPYRETVERGLRWIVSAQGSDGDLRQGETMYSHGIATIALCEAYGMTGDLELRQPAQRAVDFIVNARHRESGGWRYDPRQFGDTSVLGWQIMALVSARRAGLEVPDEALDRAHDWLDEVSHPRAPGRYAYQPGIPPTPSMTAEGLFVRQLLGDDATMERGRDSVALIDEHPPRWDEDANTYYWYYATLALYQHGGESWEAWNERLVPELLEHQHQDGRLSGSWNPADQWSTIGGRVYQTALCTLSLEVYYRYLPQYLTPADAGD
ncbi:MAG: hypothetical protein ACF8PN_02860 [Phycisphaerales bacterium]